MDLILIPAREYLCDELLMGLRVSGEFDRQSARKTAPHMLAS